MKNLTPAMIAILVAAANSQTGEARCKSVSQADSLKARGFIARQPGVARPVITEAGRAFVASL